MSEAAAATPATYRAYRRRWLYLFVIVTAQITNETAWLSFSPVASYVAHYYNCSLSDINLQMTVFMVIHFFVTPFVIWAVDQWSFRWVLVIGAVLNGVGMTIKGISTWDAVTPVDLRYTITMVGSIVVAVSQPFTLMIPTRFSQKWHPPHERTMSTALASLAAPIGGLLALSVTPLYVRSPSDVPLINTIWVAPALVSTLVAVFGVTMSSPPTPPSASAGHQPKRPPFLISLKTMFTRPSVLCLALCIGPSLACINTFATLLGQMLCPRGYSPELVGLCGALLFGCSVPGAALLSGLAVKTGKAIEVVKVSYCISCIVCILLCQALLYRDVPGLVAACVGSFGFLGIGLYPLILELGVEASYPTDQSYSSAMIFLPGSIIGAALVALSTPLGRPLSDADRTFETCSIDGATGVNRAVDYTYFYMLLTAMNTLCGIMFLIIFKTPYHRTNTDVGVVLTSPASATAYDEETEPRTVM